MTRKKFRIFLIAFIIISFSIVSGFMVANLKKRGTTSSGEGQVERVQEGTAGDYSNAENDGVKNLEFFVNESAVVKRKLYSQETTMLTFEAKLFVTNNSAQSVEIDPDLLNVTYDSDGQCQLYEIDYGDLEKPVVVAAKETAAIELEIKFFVINKEFTDYIKRDLKFNYKAEQIFTCLA